MVSDTTNVNVDFTKSIDFVPDPVIGGCFQGRVLRQSLATLDDVLYHQPMADGVRFMLKRNRAFAAAHLAGLLA